MAKCQMFQKRKENTNRSVHHRLYGGKGSVGSVQIEIVQQDGDSEGEHHENSLKIEIVGIFPWFFKQYFFSDCEFSSYMLEFVQ